MTDQKQHLSGSLLAFLYFLFFLSGFSALVYQVIWQRMLGLFSGVDLYSATIIVSAFMLGMGCGTLAGGYLSDRRNTTQLLGLFALAELMIGAFALFSKFFYYDILYQSFPGLGASPLLLGLVLFLSLLVPTFFMGLTLPLLSKALTRELNEAAQKIGSLYGINTLGASVGALSSFFLIRAFGFQSALQIGASLNLAVMAGALVLLRVFRRVPDAPLAEKAPAVSAMPSAASPLHREHPGKSGIGLWVMVYGVSGFLALGLELLWLRLVNVFYGSVSYTFSVIMFLYLLGLALGTFAGLYFAPRSRRPVTLFLGLQAGIALYSLFSVTLIIHFLDSAPLFADAWTFLSVEKQLQSLSQAVNVYVLLPVLVIIPPTLLMGASFPYLQQIVHNDMDTIGRKVGLLQTANILGATLGASCVGIVLLGWFGTSGTLKLLFLASVLYPLLWWKLHRSQGGVSGFAAYGLIVMLYAGAAFMLPDNHTLWAKMHGRSLDKLIVSEDGSGVVAARGESRAFSEPGYSDRTQIYLNGSSISALPYGGLHTKLGLLPVILHPDPQQIAIIGLGSGDTLFATGSRQQVSQVTNIEIAFQQQPVLKQLHAQRPYPGIERLFSDPRFRYIHTDARTWLMRSGQRFDIIEADALYPNHAYSGNLYSREYFELMRAHLKPGGFAASWIPTARTAQTFRSVFPHILNIGDWLFIGSNEPIEVDLSQVQARLHDAFTREYFETIGYDHVRAVMNELQAYTHETGKTPDSAHQLNTDLYPRDEFLVSQ